MPKVILNQIINQLETLDLSELQQLNQVLQQYLVSPEASAQKTRFHNALLTSGLVKQIKQPTTAPQTRQLIEVQGEAVSETIIKERR
ncbi:hypothetical protein [Gloeocapsa sp. PCC 73106]|uniref:hypothetical protein n=1 Tax=Gloeocapsa sp. PCC 73106 TaxID=102232 RepID=UPI0002ABC542|nr:hypothetical protein [Gloeocapsa sp. PCC 73106]ELR99183.1 hypothetical protein GLO73106DRAFT_00030320 [Gloeocapsa sp. PCC 73106]